MNEWAKGCGGCSFGLKSSGGYCDCRAGEARKRGDEKREEMDRQLVGGRRSEPLSLEVIPQRYREFTWGKVLQQLKESGKIQALRAAKAWADNPSTGLLLLGPVGSGKTTFAALVAMEFLREGVPVRFEPYALLMTSLGSMGFNESSHEIMKLTRVPLLVLDDLGAVERSRGSSVDQETARRVEIVSQIVSSRIASGFPTIITSNLNLAQLGEQFGKPFGSRLQELDSITLNGRDMRGSQ